MPRKPKSWRTVDHGPFKADITVRRRGGRDFSCGYGGDYFASSELVKVRKWAIERLRAMATLDWKPVMEVNFDSEDDQVNGLRNCSNVRCYVERYYIAWDEPEVGPDPVGGHATRHLHVLRPQRL